MDLRESLKIFSFSSIDHPLQLKKRYRELIKRYHPDRLPQDPAASMRRTQELNCAYDILKKYLRMSRDRRPAKPRDLEGLIRQGDRCLRDAVLTGWLHRIPHHAAADALKAELERIAEEICSQSRAPADASARRLEFFQILFTLFLRATDSHRPRPLPVSANATSFFRQVSLANRILDTGIRHYYHHEGGGSLATYGRAVAAFLEDSLFLYSWLLPHIRDPQNLQRVQARMELCRMFLERVADAALRCP